MENKENFSFIENKSVSCIFIKYIHKVKEFLINDILFLK